MRYPRLLFHLFYTFSGNSKILQQINVENYPCATYEEVCESGKVDLMNLL